MPEFYAIISSILLAMTSVLFFVRWRMEARHNNSVQLNSEIKNVINLASLGGYYYWDKSSRSEEFSLNLISLFNLHKKSTQFSHFVELFDSDKEKLIDLFEGLKRSESESFSFKGKVKISGKSNYIECVGNRIDNEFGKVSGIVIWFYNISEYENKVKTLTAQNKTLKSEVRDYSNILNSLSFPIWKREEDSHITYCNVTYMNCVDEKNSISKDDEIPELDSKIAELSKKSLQEDGKFNAKKHIIINGERRLFDINESKMKGGHDIVGVAYDVNEQEVIQKELERHVSAHDDLLESSSSAMAIYGPDTELKFYNNAFVKLWGLKDKWLESSPTYSEVLELFREQRKLPEQADFKKFRDEQMKMFKNLIEPHNDFFYLPDGRTLRVIVIPHALGGLLFAYEDMTDRFAIERSYNTLMAVQQETLDNLREGILVFGADGVLKLYNPTYVEMWPEEKAVLDKRPRVIDLVNKSKDSFIYNDWEEFKKYWLTFPSTRKPLLKRVERTDGKVIEKITIPLPDGDYMLSYHDVTDSIRAERSLMERNEALEAVDKLKTEFLANVSYELRTPLTSIKGFSEVLEGEFYGKLNAEQEEYVKGIKNSSGQLMELINDILDLASIEAGYMSLEVKKLDVHKALKSVVTLFIERCRDAKIKINLDCPDEIGEILGDEKRIKQIMINMIGNSMKFTKEGGKITVGAEESKKGEIVIWVEDNGIGIPRDEKTKVFDRFFKTSGALSMKKLGTGLGLSVVKNIVELHDGKIRLESAKGKGTKVLCFFKRNNPKLLKKEKGAAGKKNKKS